MTEDTRHKPPDTDFPKRKRYLLRMSSELSEKLEQAVLELKKNGNYSYSRQQLVTEAIQKKLKQEENLTKENEDCESCSSENGFRILNILIDENLEQKLSKSIQAHRRKGHDAFTKKDWLVDAIQEMLNETS